MESNCIFCDIVAGHGNAEVIAENEASLAFMDAFPINPGHALVVPRVHAQDIHAMSPAQAASMFTLGQAVAGLLQESEIPVEGINFVMSNGAAADQSVFHAHLHVIPRVRDDGFSFVETQNVPNSPGDLARAAQQLRKARGSRSPKQ